MTTFLLAVDEAWSRIGRIVAFVLSVGAPGSEHFFPCFFFYLPCFCFVCKLSVGVSGSVPEREHDHLFDRCRRSLVPGWEHFHLFALCRRVGLGPGSGTCRGGALSRIGIWPLLFPPRACFGVGARSRIGNGPLLFCTHVSRRGSAWGRVGNGPLLFPPPRFGVRLGPELGTGLFSFTPPCRRGALSRVENGPRLSHPPTCFGGGLGSGLGTGLSSFAPPCRLSAPSRIEIGPLLLCASLTSVRSPRAGYYQHAALGRLRSGTNSDRLSRTSALYNKPRARTARLLSSLTSPIALAAKFFAFFSFRIAALHRPI